MEKCCDVEGIRSLTKVIKHFWLKIWEGTIIWLIESDRSIYTFHSVKCNNVEFLISDQDVWHGWIPSIPRKRIRGIYPPSGLKESSLGSSSSWSNKTWIEKEKFINVNDVPHTVKQCTNHGTLIAIFFLIIMTKGWAAFPHLQVDHDKAVCKLRDFLGLGKFGLECFSNNKSQLILIHLLSKPPPHYFPFTITFKRFNLPDVYVSRLGGNQSGSRNPTKTQPLWLSPTTSMELASSLSVCCQFLFLLKHENMQVRHSTIYANYIPIFENRLEAETFSILFQI